MEHPTDIENESQSRVQKNDILLPGSDGNYLQNNADLENELTDSGFAKNTDDAKNEGLTPNEVEETCMNLSGVLVPKKKFAGNLYAEKCPSREIFDHLTSTWGSLIIVLLMDKTYRFSELRKKIGGISEKMLAQTLQILERDGFVNREVHPVMPPKVEYSLSPLGFKVAEKVKALTDWVEDHLIEVIEEQKKREIKKMEERDRAERKIKFPFN